MRFSGRDSGMRSCERNGSTTLLYSAQSESDLTAGRASKMASELAVCSIVRRYSLCSRKVSYFRELYGVAEGKIAIMIDDANIMNVHAESLPDFCITTVLVRTNHTSPKIDKHYNESSCISLIQSC